MGIHERFEQTESGRRDVSDQRVPVALVETKGAKKGLEEALVQIRRYHRETPEMLTTPQVFDITHLLEFYYARDLEPGSQKSFQLARGSVGEFRSEGESVLRARAIPEDAEGMDSFLPEG